MPAGAASRYALGDGGVGAARPAPAASLISASRYALGARRSAPRALRACVPGGAAHRGGRRAPRQPADRPGSHAARSRALSAPSTAVACGRPRRGAVAALVARWSHDDDHLPGGRVTRALPPPAKGHGRGAWCKRRNRTAGGRWGQHLPGQPASRLHPHALVRAAFDNAGSDRHGLWVRHADTHAQSNTPFALNRPRRSARHGRDSRRLARSPGRVDRSCRSSGPLVEVEWTGARGEWTSREWRVGEFQGATRRYTGSTRPVEWPHGESTRRGAAVHSVRRVARGGGRLAPASRPPPVPVPPPLSLQTLPTYLLK